MTNELVTTGISTGKMVVPAGPQNNTLSNTLIFAGTRQIMYLLCSSLHLPSSAGPAQRNGSMVRNAMPGQLGLGTSLTARCIARLSNQAKPENSHMV